MMKDKIKTILLYLVVMGIFEFSVLNYLFMWFKF